MQSSFIVVASAFIYFRYHFDEEPFVEAMEGGAAEAAILLPEAVVGRVGGGKVNAISDAIVQVKDLIEDEIVSQIEFVSAFPEEPVPLSDPVVECQWFVEGDLCRCRKIVAVWVVVEGMVECRFQKIAVQVALVDTELEVGAKRCCNFEVKLGVGVAAALSVEVVFQTDTQLFIFDDVVVATGCALIVDRFVIPLGKCHFCTFLQPRQDHLSAQVNVEAPLIIGREDKLHSAFVYLPGAADVVIALLCKIAVNILEHRKVLLGHHFLKSVTHSEGIVSGSVQLCSEVDRMQRALR